MVDYCVRRWLFMLVSLSSFALGSRVKAAADLTIHSTQEALAVSAMIHAKQAAVAEAEAQGGGQEQIASQRQQQQQRRQRRGSGNERRWTADVRRQPQPGLQPPFSLATLCVLQLSGSHLASRLPLLSFSRYCGSCF